MTVQMTDNVFSVSSIWEIVLSDIFMESQGDLTRVSVSLARDNLWVFGFSCPMILSGLLQKGLAPGTPPSCGNCQVTWEHRPLSLGTFLAVSTLTESWLCYIDALDWEVKRKRIYGDILALGRGLPFVPNSPDDLFIFLIKISHKRKDTLDTLLPGLVVFLRIRNLQSLHIDLKHTFDIIMLSMAILWVLSS